MRSPHIPVLLDEVLQSFTGMGKEGYFVDCTLGYAGHSQAMLERYSVKHIGIDRDAEALAFSQEVLHSYQSQSTLYKGTFAEVVATLSEAPIYALLADFGVSSLQLDKLERGFGFEAETLDMRMDSDATLSAYDVVNGYTQTELEKILREYGEVPQAKALSVAIVEARSKAPIDSAKVLSKLAVDVLGNRGKIHPATLLFQAIRIEVNGELSQITKLLDALEKKHYKGMVVSLITFHSLEDRLVKERFKLWSKNCICDTHAMRCTCGNNHALGKMLQRKPVTASKNELKQNPRSRSAKLRSFQFLKELHDSQ